MPRNPVEDDVIVGMDNGNSGGFAAISGFDGSLISKLKTPTVSRKLASAKKPILEPDVGEIVLWLRSLESTVHIFIEEAPLHAKSARALRSQAICFAMVYGRLLGEMANYIEVHTVDVKVWQKEMLGKVPRGRTKEYAEAEARRLNPDENWFATDRSTTPHDGIIDAYLIAQYGRGKLKG
jgi:hypothetical protein